MHSVLCLILFISNGFSIFSLIVSFSGDRSLRAREFDRANFKGIEMQRHSYSVERNFGVLVGLVFSALGGWWLFRGKFPALAPLVSGIGAALLILGLFLPRALVIPNRLWMKLAEGLSFVMTRVILGLVFFLVAMPIGLIRMMLGGDSLNRRAAPKESYWRPYLARQTDRRHYEKMY